MYKYLFVLLFLFPVKVPGQQDAQLLCYNVGFGGLSAGVGALFNKPKHADWKKTFLHAFWQGCIGGALHYSGKKTLYLINRQQSINYGLPAMLLHAAGNSVVENAAYNRPFLQSWNLYYGPLRFDISLKEKIAFKARLLPTAVVGTLLTAHYGRPDWGATLLTGCIMIKNPELLGGAGKFDQIDGITYGRSIAYTSHAGPQYTHEVIAHELTHYFQFNEYLVFNAWMAPAFSNTKHKGIRKVFTNYVYLDAPYFLLPYALAGSYDLEHYYRNFFEMEAERFATNREVPR